MAKNKAVEQQEAMESVIIAPNITVTVVHTTRFKLGYFSLCIPTLYSVEAVATRALLFSVLRRGTERFPTMEAINLYLDDLYATPYQVYNRAKGDFQCLGFRADLLEQPFLFDQSDVTSGALDLMMQMLFYPVRDADGRLSSRYLASEQKHFMDAIDSLKNYAKAYASAQFLSLYYEGKCSSSALSGTKEQLAAVTLDALEQERLQLLRHAPIHCFYIGRMSAEELIEQLKHRLLPSLVALGRDVTGPSEVTPLIGQGAYPLPWEGVRRVEQELDAGQSHLILGFRTGVTRGSAAFYAMLMCQEILGGSPISRLFVHVREKHSLCYSCSSEYVADRGDIFVECGIRADRAAQAEQAIIEQIEVLKAGTFTDDELQAAKKSLDSAYRQIGDSTRSMARFYELRQWMGIEGTPEDYRRAIEQISREQIRAAAQTIELRMVYFLRGIGTDRFEDDACDAEVDE